jgi:hypothetical protein
MKCSRCGSARVGRIGSKSSDCNSVSLGDKEHNGYVPGGMGIGGGDYVEFSWCLDCGQIQEEEGTKFPLPPCKMEQEEEADE